MALHVSSTRRWSALAAAALLAAGTFAACGDDNDDSSTTAGGSAATAPASTTPAGAASTRLALTADENGGLSFSRRALTARPGDVTIALDNPSGNQMPHAIEIEGDGVEEESTTIEPGGTASVTANLRPGTYTFYCPVGDHRQEGMEGTLTVG